MQISPSEIESRKEIGTLDGYPVIELALKGGFHLVMQVKGPKIDFLGAGSHKCVARHLAKVKHKSIKFTELSKADHVPLESFQHLLPRFATLTDRLNQLNPRK